MSHDLGILDITWKSSHLVDHIPNGWVMWKMGTFNDPRHWKFAIPKKMHVSSGKWGVEPCSPKCSNSRSESTCCSDVGTINIKILIEWYIEWVKQCHKPPMTGNGKFIPPHKMVIFLGDGKHGIGNYQQDMWDDFCAIRTGVFRMILWMFWDPDHPDLFQNFHGYSLVI